MSESVEHGKQARTVASAVERLQAGNARFLDGIAHMSNPAAVTASLSVANPYAIVLGCSDSRVPPETVFNESVGRLFVIRVASNVAGHHETGTIEYALARWGCPLVVILGHTQCGGIGAAMDRPPAGVEELLDTAGSVSLSSMLSSIRSNLGWAGGATSQDPWADAVRANIRRTMEQLLTWSQPIRRRVDAGQLTVVGAIYHVETGAVEFLGPI